MDRPVIERWLSMKWNIGLLVWLFLSFAGLVQAVFADEVILEKGDRITGTVVRWKPVASLWIPVMRARSTFRSIKFAN